jgi:LCP family protein required for cell wall assembly
MLPNSMPDSHVNLLNPNQLQPPRSRKSRRKGFFAIGVIILFVIGAYLFTNFILPGLTLSRTFASASIVQQIKHLTLSGDRDVSSDDNRVNALIIGIGGEGHDGALLADTLILVSYDKNTNRAAMLSIPRDLYIPFPDGSWRKINETYSYGTYETEEGGADTARQIISSLFGTDIPYHVVVDFSGFEEIIDSVGGLDIYVDRTFSDPIYPVDDKRTEFIKFEQGWQHFDGATALIYARSRMGTNGEGSDFARAKRQQKILLALKEKVLKGQTLLNPITMNRLSSKVADNIQTNVESWEALRFYQMAGDVNGEQILRVTLTDAPGGILTSSTSPVGAYILQPRNGDYQLLKTVVNELFSNGELVQEPARVEVQNGTKVAGLATTKADDLARLGYTVTYIGNAEKLDYKQTTIYDLTGGTRPTALAALRLNLNATVASSVPNWLSDAVIEYNLTPSETPITNSQADFLVILGNDSTITAEE